MKVGVVLFPGTNCLSNEGGEVPTRYSSAGQ